MTGTAKGCLGAFLLLGALAASAEPAAPFRLPVGATLAEPAADARGWLGEGRVRAPFVQARGRLLSAVTASGWRLLHEIPLGTRHDRILMAFSRGGRELTVMVWRIAVDRSGFSYGVSDRREK